MAGTAKRIFHALVVVCVIGLGIGGFLTLTASKPKIKKGRPGKPVPLVRVIKAHARSELLVIKGQGTVRPVREMDLVPEVGGRVIYVSSSLVNGGEFKKGEMLIKIDPTDYELAITLAQAKVRSAQSNLELLEEEAAEARAEWEMNHADKPEVAKNPPPLLVKTPQIQAARAQLEAARAELRKSLLDLERTELLAPFDGRVAKENVGVGQYVRPGQALARIFSIEAVEISVPLERDDIGWICVPGISPGVGAGSVAKVAAELGGIKTVWRGMVARAEAKIDEHTRMVNVVIRINRPYDKRPPLVVGLFVDVFIQGKKIAHVVSIPVWALRENNVVWLVRQGRLVFSKVKLIRIEGDEALITEGIRDGDMVVVSHHKVVTNGMSVRVEQVSKENSR